MVMALRDAIEEVRRFPLDQLELNNIGSWPVAIKAGLVVLVIFLIALLGYFFWITDKRVGFGRETARERDLKGEYEQKAGEAKNLDALRRQRDEAQASFGALLRQLPVDTEVPGLLEDITNAALESNLKIESVDLQEERPAEFYIELPIIIKVEGSYHDLGAFVSSVANLSRIVTLHDFTIVPKAGADHLAMTILARTYRYLDEEAQAKAQEKKSDAGKDKAAADKAKAEKAKAEKAKAEKDKKKK